MPVGTVLFLAFLFRPLCMVQGELDWRLLMLLVGIPFGIRKMFLWVVPSGMGIGGTVGVAAFDLMAGGVIGSVIMVWRLLVEWTESYWSVCFMTVSCREKNAVLRKRIIKTP